MAEGKAEGIVQGKAQGEAIGKAKGIAEGKAKVIKNLLSLDKFSISDIAELANVTVEFVKQIEAEEKDTKGK
ncbi:hypothetical protein [Sphingobacterium sp. DR205]|uniref:hypothetical protein n=1 Tax=Sphingobacterium sp. DR205 TaxID=2713573 RepID=UPI0013E4CA51|nr:hypothetical protein [Sphingobacterium sp. DR205]QIH33812.1 hypothetical protein G6053_13375 [Sphingobacterium sp. DR205]